MGITPFSTLDLCFSYSDHLLICLNGPLRIHCYNNLVVSIICSAQFKIIPVFLSNKGLLLMMAYDLVIFFIKTFYVVVLHIILMWSHAVLTIIPAIVELISMKIDQYFLIEQSVLYIEIIY